MPERGDKATCAECGAALEWHYTHGEWGWKVVYIGLGTSKYCYPLKDWETVHRP